MLKTCNTCGVIHDFDKQCYVRKKKNKTKQDSFRNTYAWQKKREEIKDRDMHICQMCLKDRYDTDYVYNYDDLEVHHIVSIIESYEKRLDSYNLITLCNMHHRIAEEGIIERAELQKIVQEYYDPPQG